MKRNILIHKTHYDIDVTHKELFDKFGEGKFCINIKSWEKERGIQLNRYHWGVVVDTVQQVVFSNFPPLAVHEILLSYFAPKEHEKIIRSSDQTNKEMMSMHDLIRQWMLHKHNTNIPLPNEVDMAQFYPNN